MKFIYFNQRYFSDKVMFQVANCATLIPEPWLFYKNSVKKLLCHIFLSSRINSKMSLPFKSIWIKDLLNKNFSAEDDVCIIINAHFYQLYYGDIIEIARKRYHSAKFVLIFSDKVEYFQNHYSDFPDIARLKKDFDAIITYNSEDYLKYGIILDRPCFPTYKEHCEKLGNYESDIFFVGYEKGRLKQIYDVFEFCKRHGLKCDFHISGVEKDEQKYTDEISFNKPIPYSEVIERCKKTKCILNIIQSGGSGVTLRDYEALSFNKLTLTNNKALLVTGLYTKEQVIWLDELKERVEDIRKGYQGNNSYAKMYSQEQWFCWLSNLLSV